MALALLEANPELHVTAVERYAAVLQELQNAAEAIGVHSRLDLVLSEVPNSFPTVSWDVVYWSQAFFSPTLRTAALRAIRRSLAPGGLFFEFPYAHMCDGAEHLQRRSHLFDVAAFSLSGMPLLDAEQLTDEAEQQGFSLVERRVLWGTDLILVFE